MSMSLEDKSASGVSVVGCGGKAICRRCVNISSASNMANLSHPVIAPSPGKLAETRSLQCSLVKFCPRLFLAS